MSNPTSKPGKDLQHNAGGPVGSAAQPVGSSAPVEDTAMSLGGAVAYAPEDAPTGLDSLEPIVRARPTGFAVGGWYPIDAKGEIIRNVPDGELPKRFATWEKACEAGLKMLEKQHRQASTLPQPTPEASKAAREGFRAPMVLTRENREEIRARLLETQPPEHDTLYAIAGNTWGNPKFEVGLALLPKMEMRQLYETAAWWTKVALPAQEIVLRRVVNERDCFGFAEGKIIENYTPTQFGGVNIPGPYDRFAEAGKTKRVSLVLEALPDGTVIFPLPISAHK